jgi:hypothetical protein
VHERALYWFGVFVCTGSTKLESTVYQWHRSCSADKCYCNCCCYAALTVDYCRTLAAAMEQHIKEMSLQVASACSRAQGGRIQLGFDYIVAADVLAPSANNDQQLHQQSTLPLPPPLTAAAAASSSSDHGASPMDEDEPAAAAAAAAAAPEASSMNGGQTAAC